MSEQQPSDQAARERFYREWRRNFAVSANAGSGKTTAISERLACMALDPEAAEALRRMAVVTYTVKAAAEIGERARERLLQKIGEAARGGLGTGLGAEGGEDERSGGVGADAGEGRRAAGVGLAALEQLERVFFGTLHGFCLKLARDHGLESGLELTPEVLGTEADLEGCWEDFLAEDPMAFVVLDEARRAALFRHVEMEAVMLRARELPVATAQALVQRAPSGPPPEPNWAGWEVLLALTPKGSGKSNTMTSQERARIWRERYEDATDEGFLGIYEPTGTGRELVAASRRWMAPLLAWVSPAAGAVAGELALRFQAFRKARGVQTYEDQVEAARGLLEKRETREAVRAEGWRVILDEAQDTDEAQFGVLVEITRPPGAEPGMWPGKGVPPRAGHFCMVGDGQQAIYGSRASVRTFQRYMEAFDGGAAGDALNFEVTFRAPHAVVELLNQSLPAAFAPEREHNRGVAPEEGAPEPCLQVAYQPLRAGPTNSPGAVGRIVIEGLTGKQSGKQEGESFREEMRQVAAWLKERGPAGVGVSRWGELCVLLPRNSWMDTATAALQDAGLKVARQSKRVRAGAQTVYAWLTGLVTVCCFPDDAYEWFGVLREVFGVSDGLLAEEQRRLGGVDWENPERHAEPVREALSLMRPSLLSVDDDNVALDAWCSRLIKACGLAAKTRALDSAGDASRDLARLQAEARVLAGQGASPRDWWHHLLHGREACGGSGRAADDAVNLLTCHSAKGLEWPAVLVPGLWRKVGFENAAGLQVMKDAAGAPMVYLKAGYVPAETKISRERERARELVRLLYVTLTRARLALWLPWAEGLVAAPGQSLAGLWGHELMTIDGQQVIEQMGETRSCMGNPLRSSDGYMITEAIDNINFNGYPSDFASIGTQMAKRAGYQRMLPHEFSHNKDFIRNTLCNYEEIHSKAVGGDIDPIAYGLWWHETMEFLPWTAGLRELNAYGNKRLLLAREWGAERRAEEEWRLLLASPSWSSLADKRWDRKAELAVLAPLGSEKRWIDGVMDLVLRDAVKDEVWLVDWKTNRRRQNEERGGMLARLVTEYSPQLEAYALSLGQIFPSARIRGFIFSTAFGELVEVAFQQDSARLV